MDKMTEGLREILEGSKNVTDADLKKIDVTNLSDILVDAMRAKLDVIAIRNYIFNKINAQGDFLMDHNNEEISSFTKGLIVGELKMIYDILKIIDPEHAKEILDISEGTEIGMILGYNPDEDDEDEEEDEE